MLGEIRADAVYPLEVFRQRTGLDTWATRQARRAGLRVRRVGRRGFILGTDFIQYLESLTAEHQ
jgi:hypothetical protein